MSPPKYSSPRLTQQRATCGQLACLYIADGLPAFWGDSNAELFAQVGLLTWRRARAGARSAKMPNLVLKMLTHDPESRPTLTQVRTHPWMSRHAKPADEVVPGRGPHACDRSANVALQREAKVQGDGARLHVGRDFRSSTLTACRARIRKAEFSGGTRCRVHCVSQACRESGRRGA